MTHFKTAISICILLLSTPAYPLFRKSAEPSDCGEAGHPYRITARHIEPQGIGYNQGYTTLEGFFTLKKGWEDWLPFLDVRGHMFNNGKAAINAGLGLRYLANQRIWGINGYYDYRNTKHLHYNQVAMGLEALGDIWDFRINGYLPVGKKHTRNYDLRFVRFEGHSAIVKSKYEYALAGANAEAGAHLDYWENFPLYFAAGPYYLNGKGGSAWGGQFRASLRIYDYVKVDGNVSYDQLFKWIGQGEVGLTLSFGSKKKVAKQQNIDCSVSLALAERMYQPVDRFEIIPVDKKQKQGAAIDPTTGLPYTFIFVDNTSSSLGTYESPYPTLANAETNSNPYDIIYIFPGNRTTVGLDAGIILQDYQKLWGSGINQHLTTTLGLLTIPSQSASIYNGIVITPILTNPSGSVVFAKNGNEISGLFLANQGSNDCVSCFDKNSLTVLNSTLAALNAPGAIGINTSGLSGTLSVSGCDINQVTNGIKLQNSSGSVTANIENTTFSSPGDVYSAIQLILSNTASGDLNVNNCTATTRNSAIGIDLSETSQITTLISDNNFDTGSYGLYINSSSGETSIDATIKNNTMTTSGQSVWIAQTGSAIVTLDGNDLYSNGAASFEIDVNTGSTNANLTIVNNSMVTDGYDNVFFNHFAGDLSATLEKNNFKGVDYNTCIHSEINDVANIHTLVINNNIITSGDNGIEIDQNRGSVNVSANNNIISSLYDSYGIYWNLQETPVSSVLTMTGNTITAYQGLYVYQSSTCTLDVAFNNNNVETTSTGIEYRIVAESSNNISMNGNTMIGSPAVELEHNIGSIHATITNNNLTSINNPALYYNVNSFGAITEGIVNATGNTLRSGGQNGANGSAIFAYLHATGPVTTNFTNNTLNGDSQAVTVNLDGITQIMDLSNNTVPTGGGFSLTANSGTATWTVNGNEFTALSSSPIAATSAGGNICMQMNHNTAYPTANAYVLTNSAGTFILNTPEGNIGDITSTATPGTCP